MRPAIASGIVPGDALGSYWLFFSLVSSNSSRSLCESNSSQFPFRFTILHATKHQIKKEHSFISKLLKTRQYSLMNSRVPFLKDRVSAIPGRQLSLRSFRLFSGSFSVDKTVLRSKARKRVYYSWSYMFPERWLCFKFGFIRVNHLSRNRAKGFSSFNQVATILNYFHEV